MVSSPPRADILGVCVLKSGLDGSVANLSQGSRGGPVSTTVFTRGKDTMTNQPRRSSLSSMAGSTLMVAPRHAESVLPTTKAGFGHSDSRSKRTDKGLHD